MANKIKIDNSVLKKQKNKEKKPTRKKQMSCRILIVAEGEKTEPNYFDHFVTKNNNSFVYDIIFSTKMQIYHSIFGRQMI